MGEDMTALLSLDDARLTAEFPTADECLTAYYLWIAAQERPDTITSFSLFMSAKMGELYARLHRSR
jgi:hypothetical protein